MKFQRKALERILAIDEIWERITGFDPKDRETENGKDTTTDIMENWHLASYADWTAQSIPGMFGTVHFLWLDVPGEALTFLENGDIITMLN